MTAEATEARRTRVEQLLNDSDDLVFRMRLVAAQLKAFSDHHREDEDETGGEGDGSAADE